MWQELEKKKKQWRRPSANRMCNVSIPPSVHTHPMFFAGLRLSMHFKWPNTSLVTVYQSLSFTRASLVLPRSLWPKIQHWEGDWLRALEHSKGHTTRMSTDPASGRSHWGAITPHHPPLRCTESPPSLLVSPVTKHNLNKSLLRKRRWKKGEGMGRGAENRKIQMHRQIHPQRLHVGKDHRLHVGKKNSRTICFQSFRQRFLK